MSIGIGSSLNEDWSTIDSDSKNQLSIERVAEYCVFRTGAIPIEYKNILRRGAVSSKSKKKQEEELLLLWLKK